MHNTKSKPKAQPSSEQAVSLYLNGLAKTSAKRQVSALAALERMIPGPRLVGGFDWASMTLEQVGKLRAAMAERYAPTTANAHKSAFDGVITACRRMGLITSEHEDNLKAVMKPFRGGRKPLRQYVTPAEMQAMFDACDRTSTMGRRDAAMMALLYAGAMRSFEARGAMVEDIDWASMTIRVLGKGNKERHVQMTADSMALIRQWLDNRRTGRIICAVSKHGMPMRVDRGLGWDAMKDRIVELYTRAGLSRLTTHDLRRACLTQLIEVADVHAAQEHAGHADPSTTRRYDMTAVQRKLKALESITFFTSKGE